MNFDSKGKIKLIIFVFSFLLLIICFFFVWQGIYLPKEKGCVEEIQFSVEKGEGAKEISINLKERGLIKCGPLFRIYALLKGVSGKLKAGDYRLSKSMPIAEIVDKFVKGDIIKEEITIIEGWNFRNIGWYFENKGMFMAEELFELAGFPLIDYSKETEMPKPKDFSKEFIFLEDKPKDTGLEGYLFPDTYEIYPDETLEDIVRKMLENFDKKLSRELREEIEEQGKTIFEIITMASLIEKEVKTFEDRKIVSGILWKRLENYIPLQVDATISYITGKKTTKISTEETKINSPYNTYKFRGMPFGPICSPGLESILSAVYPEENPYLYYLSTPEGETIFSKTLKDHNAAKAKYLK